MLIVAFNGPPGSGKTTICRELAQALPSARVFSLATPLKSVASALYPNITAKEELRPKLIYLSENVLKPAFGDTIFASTLCSRLARAWDTKYALIDDLGFQQEVATLTVGWELLIVQLYRHGCTFMNDSRRYVEPRSALRVSYANNGTLEAAVSDIKRAILHVG